MSRILLFLVPAAAVCTALGQTPAAQPAASFNIVTESSKIARVLAGPGGRPQGFLLRDGTFVILPPGLSQRMPSTLSSNTAVRVAGEEFTYDGSRTVHAQHLLLAGISYDDVPPAAPRPGPALAPPPCPSGATAPMPPPVPPAPPTLRIPQAPPAAPPPPPAQ